MDTHPSRKTHDGNTWVQGGCGMYMKSIAVAWREPDNSETCITSIFRVKE